MSCHFLHGIFRHRDRTWVSYISCIGRCVLYHQRHLGSPDRLGASLVVQWLRIHTAMQRHRFDPWSGKIPHAAGQLSPCATTTEPMLWSPPAASTEPVCPRAHVQQQANPPQREARAPQLESSLRAATQHNQK